MFDQSSWGGLFDDVELEELFVSLNIFHSLFPGKQSGVRITAMVGSVTDEYQSKMKLMVVMER